MISMPELYENIV